MRRVLMAMLSSMALLIMVSCSTELTNKDEVKKAVIAQMTDWPQSRLQDLYKSFFQDRFGPGHIISDRQSAKDYIVSEMNEAESFIGPEVYPCGWEGNYIRVNLSVVADGRMTADQLTDALMESAKPVTERDIEIWKKEWKEILEVIEATYPSLPGLQEDKEKIHALLAEGEYAYHHSEQFEEAYHPHYRIIDHQVLTKYLP